MKKRVLSLFMAFVLCLTLLPAAVLAEGVDTMGQTVQNTAGIGGVYTNDEDTKAPDDKTALTVSEVQALIDALPDEVTVDNAEETAAQLAAIGAALEALTEEQLAEVDQTRYKTVCAELTALSADIAVMAANEADRPQGTGTTEDPYLIGTLDELKWFRDTVNEGKPGISAKLTADIVLEENTWTPIGDSSNAYTGTFNGGWHKISGKEITADTQNWGLFGSIGEGGTVQSLTVNLSTFDVTANAARSGVIAAQNVGIIERCAVQISTKFTFKVSVGLIAYENSGLIENCRGAMVDPYSYDSDAINVAGIAHVNSGTVKSCYFHGRGRWRNYAVDYAITSSLDSGTVENCYCYDTNSSELGNRYLDETREGIDKATLWNSSLGYTLASGQVVWLLNNGKGAATNNTEPWRQETATYGAPTLDPSDRRVTKNDDGTYTLETPHTHQVNGELKEFAAFDGSNPADSGNYYLDGDVTLDGAWTITGDTVLCLNGKTLTTAENATIVVESGTLTLIPHDKNTAGTITGLGGSIVTVRGGALMMQGGTISGNTSGIGVLLTGGSFAMQGGEISGRAVGVSVQGGTLTLSGSAKVSENTRNILLAENQKISFGTLNGDAKFGISVEGQETLTDRVAVTEETGGQYFGQLAADGFKEDGTGFELYLSEDGKAVTLGKQAVHTHCICGAGYTNSGHTDHADVTFQPWTKTDSLPQEGNYYLTRNVTLTNDATLKSANICLNGYTVTLSDSATRIRAGVYGTDGCWGSLTDCVGKGTVTGGGVNIWYNGKVNLYSGTLRSTRVEISQTGGGTFNLYGGTITGNETTVAPVDGQNSDKITVNMYGGEISGNRNTSENEDEGGGGVYVGQGNQFNMYGGTIKNNSAKNGGGVRIAAAGTTYGSGTFTMSGGEISGNTASGKGGGVYVGGWINVSGSAEIYDNTGNGGTNNVYLPGGKAITLTGELLGTHPIGVTTAAAPADGKPVTIVRGSNDYTIKAADQDHFTSDVDNSYEMNLTGNALELAVKPHVHPVSTGANVTWKPLGSEAELRGVTAVTRDSCYYYLTSDIALTTETWKPASGMVLDLNGHSITAQDAFDTITVGDGVSFTLVDCKGGGESTNYGFVTHFKDPNNNTKPRVSGRGVMVSDGGHFIMYGGCVGPNQTTDAGAGVYVAEGGHFAMYGGEIAGNVEPATGGSTGGGIWTAGTTTIGGSAKVTGNSAPEFGGVYVSGGTLTLQDSAKVTGNNASVRQNSGIFVSENSKLRISGSVQVTENKNTRAVSNVYLGGTTGISPIDVVGALTDDAKIGVRVSGDVLKTIDDANSVTIAAASTEGWIKEDSFIKEDEVKYSIYVTDGGKTAVLGTHLHQWTYALNSREDTIQAACSLCEKSCSVTFDKAKLYYYNGKAQGPVADYEDSAWIADEVRIIYRRGDTVLPGLPTAVGSYTASITLTGSDEKSVTIEKAFEIAQGLLTKSDFELKLPVNAVYDGKTNWTAEITKMPELGGEGKVEFVYLDPANKYALMWNTKNAGTYAVKIQVSGAANYCDQQVPNNLEDFWQFTVAPATYEYSGPQAQELIAGSGLSAIIVPAGGTGVELAGGSRETVEGTLKWYVDNGGENIREATDEDISVWNVGSTVTLFWEFTATDPNYTTYVKNGYTTFTIKEGPAQDVIFKDETGATVTEISKTYGDGAFTLAAATNADGGTISYTSSNPDAATVDAKTGEVTVLSVGETTITATAAMVPGKYKKTAVSYTLTVAPRPISDAVITVGSLTYNAKPQTPEVTVKLGETTLTEGTDYTVTVTSQTDANVNNGKERYTLTVEGKGSYTGKREMPWEIEKRILEIADIDFVNKAYDGTDDAVSCVTGVTFENLPKDVTFQKGTDYHISAAYYNRISARDADTAYITVNLIDHYNYAFSWGGSDNQYFKTCEKTGVAIEKAEAPTVEPVELTVVNGAAKTYTVKLPELPELKSPCKYGETITYSNVPTVIVDAGYYDGGATVENGVLSLPILANAVTQEGKIGEVKVHVTTDNYEDVILTVEIKAVNKIIPNGTPVLSRDKLTYGEAVSVITLSGKLHDDTNNVDVEGVFTWENGAVKPDAGCYTAAWKFTPKDADTYLETGGTVTLTVHKATPASAPKYKTITEGEKTLFDAMLEVNPKWPDGTVKWVDKDGLDLRRDTVVKANTAYRWVFIPTDTNNYNALEGSITLYSVSTGGGGGSSGTVTPPTTTETETTTDPDGTITKTETKSDGSTVETVTKPDGSTTTTETKTETKPDGSTTTTEKKSETNADGSKTETKSETTTAADGSKTETKSETKTEADGTKSETKAETKTDANGVTNGKETTKTTAPNGSTGMTTTTTENGNTKTEAEAKISEKAAEDAKKSGEAVKVPTEVKAGEDSNSAPTVKVELPKNAGETKIEIPVSDVNSGTVAVIVHPDGTEEIVKSSTTTENGLQLKIDGSATIKIIDNSCDFIDTRGHWSREEVNYVVARGLFKGIGNNLFGVGQPMTRGMVNTVLARLAGVDTTPKSGQKWYEVGTEWAKTNGITDGTNPEASVTREQLAAMLYRYAGSPAVNGELSFADADQISDYAENALIWATQNGIMNGVGNNCIAPNANAQRAQVAAMMARYLKNIG